MISELFKDKRIFIFAGHFGSGKTEIAVNFALDLVRAGQKTAIVDMDIVNPFFRTADSKDELEMHGVKVITSKFANTNVEIPALPAEINGLFEDKSYRVVFDVGGDDLGAKAISRYRDEFVSDNVVMFFVVNIKRPMTDTEEKIERLFYEIQDSSRLKFTAFVSNTNLLSETLDADIINGIELTKRVSSRLGIEVAFCVKMDSDIRTEAFSVQYLSGLPVFLIKRYIRMGYC